MATITKETLAYNTAKTRSRSYLIYLMIFTGLVAIMDQYISTVKTTAIPYILEEYNITASQFSWLEAAYLSFTFLIFLLNGLNDIIGRKWSQLVLILFMGLSSLAVRTLHADHSLLHDGLYHRPVCHRLEYVDHPGQ